jgi:cytochrome c2
LYYSFSAYHDYPERDLDNLKKTDSTSRVSEVVVKDEKKEELFNGEIFFQKCAGCHTMGKDATGPNLQGVLSRWPSKQALKEWILNWSEAAKKYEYAKAMVNWNPSANQQAYVGQLTDAELEALIKWIDEWQSPKDTTNKQFKYETDSDRYRHYELDPSRIRAIWDRRFNNTILATKEFEERLHFLHELCTAEFLDAYLVRMNKPMYEIDELCAANSTGEIRKKFLEFAARKDGSVMLKEGMQEKLSAYFEKKFKAYREASEKTWEKRNKELARLAAIADDKRREQETRDFIRKDKNFEQEFCINLTDAYKQIGVKKICNEPLNDTIPEVPPPPPIKYYNVTIDTVGWKNLDVYVFDATGNRESMTYTDPKTGKTATLTYKELSITIEGQSQYDNVFVYLLPDSLNSFQRMEQDGNVFKENLNMLFKYDAVAIAYKGDKIFFYKQTTIQPGKYTFRLSSITETELKKILNSYSKEKSSDMLNEYQYQLFEQQEAIRNVQLKNELDFITVIKTAIWNCFNDTIVIAPGAEGEDVGSGPK